MRNTILITLVILLVISLTACDLISNTPIWEYINGSSNEHKTETPEEPGDPEPEEPSDPESPEQPKPEEPSDPESPEQPKPEEPSDPEVTDIPSSMVLKKLGELEYYLYTPANPTKNMTLIVYLHGGTNRKEDVGALLTLDGFPKYLYEGYYEDLRAYVVVPKLTEDYKGWVNAADEVEALISEIHATCATDPEKVALTGHSMGGTGAYQLQARMPELFACVAPMSGSIQVSDRTLKALSKTKIWAFVGTADTVVDPDGSRNIINALVELGANAKITELEGATHFDVPSLVYKNAELIGWLVRCGE